LQIVGIFALVASLIFVGFQIKLTREIALSGAYQARAATVIDMVTGNAANEKGLAAWYAADAAGLEALSSAEVRAGNMMALALLLAYDNMLFQHEREFVSTEAWSAGRTDMKDMLRLLFVRNFFELKIERMRPSFKATFVKVIGELDTEPKT
jgi:hypothetical protein